MERSIQKKQRADILPVQSQASLVSMKFITPLLSVGGSCGLFGTMPCPKLRPAIEHSDWLISVDLSYWPCLSHEIIVVK